MDTTAPPTHVDTIAAPALHRLLEDELTYDTDARGGFTSHLAMGLVAAARLGADEATLESWFADDVDEGYLLRREIAPDWLSDRTDAVRRNGMGAEVRATLPDLVDRIGGAFHWMIRLELAIDSGHEGQVANALGDWQRRPRPAHSFLVPSGGRSVDSMVGELLGGGRPVADGWPSVVGEVDGHPDLLDEVAATVADLHWRLEDFWTLHLVTGTRAARALAPFLDEHDRRRLATAHLHALADVASQLAEPTGQPDPVPERFALPHPDEVATAAIATGDPHVVKLVYACRLEQAVTGDPIYEAIAARAARAGFAAHEGPPVPC